jgi:cyclophilin family peptidyl-prolyl cis-trans isomerase
MKRILCARVLLGTVMLTGTLGGAAAATEVKVCTDLGPFTIALDDVHAPLHTANFLEYVDQDFYAGTVFHRVIAGFMVQGGGYDRGFVQKRTLAPVPNESRNGLSNQRGTVAAARTTDPDSATSQFYVNLADNSRLDGSEDSYGYTVFGRVSEGMDTIDKIAALPTRAAGPFEQDVPQPLVAITSMARIDRSVLDALPEDGRETQIEQRIADAAENGDYQAVLKWIGHYRSTCASLSPELLLSEARAAAALLRAPRARAALEQYFTAADESADGYDAALALYETLAPQAPPPNVAELGGCKKPAPPRIPDGGSARLDDMLAGQDAVRAYMTDSEMFLDCLSEMIDGKGLSDPQHNAAVREHNRMVTEMERLAEKFNEQVRAYKERQ